MKKVKILLFAVLLSTGCLLLVPSGKAHASSDNILRKWTRINTYECIVDNKLLHSPVSQKKDDGSIRTSAVLDLVTSYETDWIRTPSYGFGGTTPGSGVACRYVVDGSSSKYNGMTNLLTYGGKTSLSGIKWNDSNPSKVEELLTSLDYVGEETEGGGGRFSIVAHRSTETCQTTIWTNCSTSESETSTVGITVTRQDDGTLLYKRDSGNFWSDLKVSFKDHNLILEAATGLTCSGGGKLEEPLQGDLNTMYSNLADRLTNTTWTVSCTTTTMAGTFATTTQSTIKYTFGVSDKVVDSSEISQYAIKDQLITAANKVNRNFTGDSLRAFSNTEKYELYDYYLNKAIVAGGAVANRKTCNPTSTTNLQPVKLLDTSDNTFKTCYVNLGTLDVDSTKVNAPNDSHTKIVEISIADVINRLDHLSTNDIDIAAITGVSSSDDPYNNPLPGDPESNPGGDAGITDGCFNSSGALGWIICPVMRIVGEAVNGIYGIVEKNYLSIKSDVVESDGLAEAWNYFQTFANIIFAILLIIVILAQVTGFGISNYGIKKILPRLIMTAILVNLSLIMCIIAADLSNITGSGFNEMLRGIQVDTLTWQDINAGTFFLDTITSIGVVGIPIAIAGTAVAITIADGGWGVLIMPLLIGALVAFFAILFFYVLLAVRKAAIVLLIAISPVAVVCYVLPNTQKLFNRWLKMFSTLLLVYPICGILMGGGNFASRLLLVTAGDAGFVYYLVCMLLSVVPFFFIPTLLKNSMSVLGSIGSKIANMGSRWSNMATGALRRSRWAQDHQQEIARNIDMNRSKRLLARNQKTLDKLNRKRTNPADSRDLSGLSASERRRYQQATFRKARAAATQERRSREEIEAANIAEYYNDEMLQNQEASARRKYRENLVNSFADGTISSGRYNRSDGTTDAVDFNDPVDIERALANLAQDVENNPDDKLAMIRLESMMEIAKRKGAKGRRAIVNAMRTTETAGSAFAAKSMAERLLLDDRTMGAFHSYDPGSESYAQDLAAGRATKSRSDYAMQTIDSMKLDNVGDLDDSFYDNLDELHKDIQNLPRTPGNAARLKTLEDSYRKAVNTMTQAASDPRYAGKIKSKDAQNIINKHAKQMYEIERDHWLNNAANLSQLTVTDASGTAIQAAGIDGQGYLTNGTTRLVDARGNNVLATDAYGSQIKAYQDVALGQGNSAEIKIPRKRNVPYVFDNATGNYQAENDAYIHTRQQWMGNNANIAQLSGYDTSGQVVNAAGVDSDGFLVDAAGGRLLNTAGGAALNANDAYDRQVVYANQRATWLRGRQANGKSNVSQLVGYDRNGNKVNATRVRGGFLFDQNNNPLLDQPGGNALKATDAYDQQINTSTGRFRGLRPEEQRVLDKILDYNASIDLQNGQ